MLSVRITSSNLKYEDTAKIVFVISTFFIN